MYESHIAKSENIKEVLDQLLGKLAKLEQHYLENPSDLQALPKLVKLRNVVNNQKSVYEISKMRADASKLWDLHRS
jgi:hypothetical protein